MWLRKIRSKEKEFKRNLKRNSEGYWKKRYEILKSKGLHTKYVNKGKGKENPLWNKGENNPNWKGGVSSFNKTLRSTSEYYQWRSNVFQRDGWRCQTCNKRGDILEAHHKIEFNQIIKNYNIDTIEKAIECKELWDLDNGVTLCETCHSLIKHTRNEDGKNGCKSK
jgi:hypothetical protein